MTNLFKLRKIIDKESKGYDEFDKASNNKLKSTDVSKLRKEFNNSWSIISSEIVGKYLTHLGKPNSYKKNKTLVDNRLKTLAGAVHSEKIDYKIKEFDSWELFMASANKAEVVDIRIKVLKKFFEIYRDEFIKAVPATEIPAGFRDKLREFVQLYGRVTSISDDLSPPRKLKNLPDDYYHSKQQVQTAYRCDFVIALRLLEKIVSEFGLKLTPKFQEMSDIAEIFENGVSAFTIGKNTINLLIAPQITFIDDPSRNGSGFVLSSLTNPSYKSADTGNLYFIKGIHVTEALWKSTKAKKLGIMDIRKITNMEQRRVVTEALGADPFENDPTAVKSKITKKGNRLITIPKAVQAGELGSSSEAIDIKILHYTDPSTGREYNSFVPPRLPIDSNGRAASNSHVLSDPDEAMAWKFGRSKSDYYDNLQDEG